MALEANFIPESDVKEQTKDSFIFRKNKQKTSSAVLACAPASVVLADGGAPAVLAPAPHSVVLADGGAPAVLALAPPSVVLADGGAPAVLAPAPH